MVGKSPIERDGHEAAHPRAPREPYLQLRKALIYILWPGYIFGRIGHVLKHVYVDLFGHVPNQDYVQANVLNRNCICIHICDFRVCHVLRQDHVYQVLRQCHVRCRIFFLCKGHAKRECQEDEREH